MTPAIACAIILAVSSVCDAPGGAGRVAGAWDGGAGVRATSVAWPGAVSSRPLALSAAFRGAKPYPADTPARAPKRPDPDPWLGEDKLRHLLLSFAVTSMGYAAARTAGFAHGSAVAVGAGAGAAAGVWKEAHDRATGGDVSARDLTWDAVGVAAGGVLAAHTR